MRTSLKSLILLTVATIGGLVYGAEEWLDDDGEMMLSEDEVASFQEGEPSWLRISAIVSSVDGASAGVVHEHTGDSAFLREGQTYHGYQVIAIDPETESVHIRRGESEYVLLLRGGQTIVQALSEDEEAFAPASVEPEEAYRSREDFLREQGEALGLIEPGDALPSEWVEPVTPEEALRRMAESVGMDVPPDALVPRTREVFLLEQGIDPDL